MGARPMSMADSGTRSKRPLAERTCFGPVGREGVLKCLCVSKRETLFSEYENQEPAEARLNLVCLCLGRLD